MNARQTVERLRAAIIDALIELEDSCACPSDDWDFYDKLKAALGDETPRYVITDYVITDKGRALLGEGK